MSERNYSWRLSHIVATTALLSALMCAGTTVHAQTDPVPPNGTQQRAATNVPVLPPKDPPDPDKPGERPAVLSPLVSAPQPPTIHYAVLSPQLLSTLRTLGSRPTRQATGSPATTQTPPASEPSRALPSPLDSPPFPSGDWNIPVIGSPDSTPDFPLQKALFGDSIKKSGIKVYGWLDAGITVSNAKNSLSPYSYNILPNKPVIDQAVLRIERVPDTAQTDHMDWGFRLSNVFGVDYRTTWAKGWFSDQITQHNNLYGYDPVEAYGLIYFPKIAQGMVLQVGRYISPPDIEAQLAPQNYLYSHSLMFTADPFTYTGINAQIKISKYWLIEIGLQAGNDMAPWQDSAQPNGEFMFGWQSPSNNDSLWFGVDSIGDGHYRHGHDDLQIVTATWGHKIDKRWHVQTEGYYEFQYDAAMGGSAINGPVEPYGLGGGQGPIIPGRSWAIGAVNYLEYKVNSRDYISLRNDFLADPQGQREGTRNTYSSHTLGYSHAFGPLTTIRPEVRYDHAYQNPAYDNGTKKEMYSFGVDLIQRF